MGSKAEDPRPRWRWIALALAVSLGLLLVFSCSPRIIERVRIQRDTTYIVKRDSVTFYDRDSIFVKEKGDTIYQYIERWRYRDRVRVDTITRVKVDSIAVERTKVVEVEKPLSAWKRAQIRGFWLLSGLLLLAVAGWLVKRKLNF